MKKEYEIVIGDNFIISYAYSLSDFLTKKVKSEDKKWKVFCEIMEEADIRLFHKNEPDYFEKLNNWIKELKI